MHGVDLLKALVDEVIPALSEAMMASGFGDNDSWKKMLGKSRDPSQGDLALPCFPLAKQYGESPDVIANRIASCFDTTCQAIGEVTATGGYLNIKADLSWLCSRLTSQESPTDAGEILIEHTSANPNGPFHVGRARNAILGDTFVRMYRAAGYDVTSEYYVDDMGKQVGMLCWGLENLSENRVDEILSESEIDLDAGPHAMKPDHNRVRWYQAANLLKAKDESVDSGVATLVQLSEEAEWLLLN